MRGFFVSSDILEGKGQGQEVSIWQASASVIKIDRP
jgi:hypothetical protein